MEKITIELIRNQTEIPTTSDIDSLNIDSISLLDSKDKLKINEIMNYLYDEYHNIDLFSTFDLERIIKFSGMNKQKTLSILENNTKEEIMKLIEESDLAILNSLKKSKSENIILDKIANRKKEVSYLIGTRQINNSQFEDANKIWDFISNGVNIVDLKDLLNSFDHFKLISKAKSIVKDKDNHKLNEFFEKYTEYREKKFKEIFRANLEENDLLFLSGDKYMEHESNKKKKKIVMNNITENMIKSLPNFFHLFQNSSNLIKSSIFEFLDIFSLGNFGMCNKTLYKLIFKNESKFIDLEKIAKNYCLAIFRNLNVYINDQQTIGKEYKNYLMMLKNRPRVRFGGVYYSRVKYNRSGEVENKMTTVIFYRFYRFMPNGDVFCIFKTPSVRSNKLVNEISRNLVKIKRGRYYIDLDYTLVVELVNDHRSSDIYKHKFIGIVEYPDLHFKGLELFEYCTRIDEFVTTVHINEYFPKIYKYRKLEIISNQVYLQKIYK